ncbi:hypothetical protein [Acetobacter pasteurianus]|uniref:Uncharacterized protein n=1 Tax=Acetobacter pasteurianus subsp. pasteurianus TaxID=481145 RepID=A0AAC9SRN3_ACEPA|nr:hypothetical protein [Acetobacter pasteurianus]ASC06048.1 hypothetical protein S101468_01811 [Acetobacter pasteurianus subsp. pasteurianus]GCD66655.1 hypothetical protein NBRC3279_2146 [Acetobacter pasteurianus NBRC 3279]GCD72986.1 hypothetical protein NBRC3284_2142 [Acetobacter pasteurianus NBRC 3284]
MDYKKIISNTSRICILFSLSLLVMLAEIYPNYNLAQFDSNQYNCILSSVAHHYLSRAIQICIVAVASGAIGFVFAPTDSRPDPINWSRKLSYGVAIFFVVCAAIGNAMAIMTIGDFLDHSAQTSISVMSKPMDYYVCKWSASDK